MTDRTGVRKWKVPWWALVVGMFVFYFGALVYSECGLPGRSWANIENKRLVQGCLLVAATWLIGTYTSDSRARIGALFLATIATAPAFPHEDLRSVWRGFPVALGALLWVPQLTHFMALPLFFTFYGSLPRPCFKGAGKWVLVWLPAMVVSIWGVRELFRRIYHPENAGDLPRWVLFASGVCILAYGFGGLGAFVWNYFREPLVERNRWRAFVIGTVVGWAPGFLFLAAIFLAPFTESRLVWGLVGSPYKHIALGMFIFAPVSLVYGTVRKGIFERRSE